MRLVIPVQLVLDVVICQVPVASAHLLADGVREAELVEILGEGFLAHLDLVQVLALDPEQIVKAQSKELTEASSILQVPRFMHKVTRCHNHRAQRLGRGYQVERLSIKKALAHAVVDKIGENQAIQLGLRVWFSSVDW